MELPDFQQILEFRKVSDTEDTGNNTPIDNNGGIAVAESIEITDITPVAGISKLPKSSDDKLDALADLLTKISGQLSEIIKLITPIPTPIIPATPADLITGSNVSNVDTSIHII